MQGRCSAARLRMAELTWGFLYSLIQPPVPVAHFSFVRIFIGRSREARMDRAPIDLSSNELGGTPPPSFSTSPNMSLFLNLNRLSGNIPASGNNIRVAFSRGCQGKRCFCESGSGVSRFSWIASFSEPIRRRFSASAVDQRR